MSGLLSRKNIPVDERLIFALDVPTMQDAKLLCEHLGGSVQFYKVGLELFMAGDGFELVRWLNENKKKVFVDLKFFDIPKTVQSAVRNLAQHGANFATVHGNDGILKAAVVDKGDLKILAVTALTSLDQGDMRELGFQTDVKQLVLSRARRALAAGCDGVISSGLEAADIRHEVGDNFLIITPGIRPVINDDDQSRTVDIEEAFNNGADYIVVGRPIREHQGFNTAREAAEHIQQRIARVFAE